MEKAKNYKNEISFLVTAREMKLLSLAVLLELPHEKHLKRAHWSPMESGRYRLRFTFKELAEFLDYCFETINDITDPVKQKQIKELVSRLTDYLKLSLILDKDGRKSSLPKK